MKQVKLLKEVYKTWEGARKRAGFENAMAKGEFDRGYKAKFYRYTIVAGEEQNTWRVARCLPDKVLQGENMFGNLTKFHSGG